MLFRQFKRAILGTHQLVKSRIAGPLHMFRVKLVVMPKGLETGTAFVMYVILHPPEGCGTWRFNAHVQCKLCGLSDPTRCISKEIKGRTFDGSSFKTTGVRCTMVNPAADLLIPETGWRSEPMLRCEATVIFPLDATRLAPTVWPELDFTEEITQVVFRPLGTK